MIILGLLDGIDISDRVILIRGRGVEYVCSWGQHEVEYMRPFLGEMVEVEATETPEQFPRLVAVSVRHQRHPRSDQTRLGVVGGGT